MLAVITGRGKVSVSGFISPSLPFTKFHLSSNFAADAKISKAGEGGTGIYTPIPAVPNKRPAESAQHHSFAARWLYRERSCARVLGYWGFLFLFFFALREGVKVETRLRRPGRGHRPGQGRRGRSGGWGEPPRPEVCCHGGAGGA